MNELFRPDADVVFLLLHFVDSQEFVRNLLILRVLT